MQLRSQGDISNNQENLNQMQIEQDQDLDPTDSNENNIGDQENLNPMQIEKDQDLDPTDNNGQPLAQTQNQQPQEDPPKNDDQQQNQRRPRPNTQGTGQKFDKNIIATLKLASINIKVAVLN